MHVKLESTFPPEGSDLRDVLRMVDFLGRVAEGGGVHLEDRVMVIGGGSVAVEAALFLPKKPWVWVYGIVAVCVGLPNCCFLPLSIPVLIFWLRPETKQYFGWGNIDEMENREVHGI